MKFVAGQGPMSAWVTQPGARPTSVTAGAAVDSARGPFLGLLQFIESEQRELTGDHPLQQVQRAADPFLLGPVPVLFCQ